MIIYSTNGVEKIGCPPKKEKWTSNIILAHMQKLIWNISSNLFDDNTSSNLYHKFKNENWILDSLRFVF